MRETEDNTSKWKKLCAHRLTKCSVPENSKERQEGLLQWTIQRNRGKNSKGKTRDLIKKIGNIKVTFHPKMSTIKIGTVKT